MVNYYDKKRFISKSTLALNASPIRDIILRSWEEEQKRKRKKSRISDKVGHRPSQM